MAAGKKVRKIIIPADIIGGNTVVVKIDDSLYRISISSFFTVIAKQFLSLLREVIQQYRLFDKNEHSV